MRVVEKQAKKIGDAIELALKDLGASLDQVKVEILSNGGIFKNAKVRVTLNEGVQETQKEKTQKDTLQNDSRVESDSANQSVGLESSSQTQYQTPVAKNYVTQSQADSAPKIEKVKDEPSDIQILRTRPNTPSVDTPTGDYVKQLMNLMGVQCKVCCYVEDKYLDIYIDTDDASIIGRRGETLDSIELLASLYANSGEGEFIRVMLDTQEFRKKRVDTLTQLAKKMAEKAVKSKRKVFLEPMSDMQRKIIHSVLQNDSRVKTRSEGDGLTRHVVIFPKR